MSLIITNTRLSEPEEGLSESRARGGAVAEENAVARNAAVITELRAGEETFNGLGDTLLQLKMQAENLTAARTRLADMDVAMDMVRFVRSRLQARVPVDNLVQPCNMPRMAVALLGR